MRALLLLLLLTATSRAQDARPDEPGPFTHRAWAMEDGLPQNSIFGITQTQDGYLWLATLQGLVRFDGHRFTAFHASEHDGLGADRTNGLFEDRSGALWVASDRGLVRFADGRFRTFTVADGLPSDLVGGWGRIAEDPDGTLWFSTDRGLGRYRDGAFSAVTTVDGLPSDYVTALLIDRDGTFWVGTNEGLARRTADGWRTLRVRDGLASDAVWDVVQQRDGSVWVGGSGGITRLGTDGLAATFPVPGDAASIIEDRTGRLWAAVPGSGLWWFDGRAFQPYRLPGDPVGLGIVRLFLDRDGHVWIGTNGNGLHRLRQAVIESLGAAAPGRSGPMAHSALQTSDGDVWMTTYNDGVLRVSGDRVRRYGPADGLPSQTTWGVVESDGDLMVSSENGVVRFDGRRFVSIGGPPEVRQRQASVTTDRRGQLLVLSRSGQIVRREGGAFRTLVEPGDYPRGGRAAVTLSAPDGSLWFGTEASGLGRWTAGNGPSGGSVRFYLDGGLPNVTIRGLSLRDDGSLWMGTYGGGLCRFDPATEVARCLTRAHGLPDDTVHDIVDDALGFVWLPSNAGLFRLPTAIVEAFFRGEVTRVTPDHFTSADGLPSTEMNGIVAGVRFTSDGRMLLPTTNGLALVDPLRIRASTDRAPVMHVESVTADDRRVSGPHVPAGTDRVAIAYTGIHLGNADALRFRYRLDGYDEPGVWVEGTDDRTAIYTNLPPGDYTFRVEGALGSGDWQLASRSLSLAPLWHQRMSVKALGVLMLLGFVGGVAWDVSRRRYRRELAALEARRALEAERARISRDMHDEVGASLSEIAVLSEVARRQLDGAQATEERLGRIADSSRLMLDRLGQIVWAINPRNDRLPALAGYLREHAARYLEAHGLKARLRFPARVPDLEVGADIRRAALLVLKEALHNVVKHAGATAVGVALEVETGRLVLTVRDDGCGFEAEPSGDGAPSRYVGGDGLGNMRKRALEVGGVLEVEAAAGGCVVRLEIPFAGSPDDVRRRGARVA